MMQSSDGKPGQRMPQPAWRSLDLSRPGLIVASAGTGKTYQLAYLVLRLVLGLGEKPGRCHALEELLVVTFTRAAAAELRVRIMELLSQVEEALRSRLAGRKSEGLTPDLCTVLAEVRERGREGECLHLLTTARSRLHESEICTIHAFCYRVLQDYALEAGLDSTLTRISGSALRELQLEAARNVIRAQLYPPADRELMFELLGGRYSASRTTGVRHIEYGYAVPDRLLRLALDKCARVRVPFGSDGALEGEWAAYALHSCHFINPGRSLDDNIRALQEEGRLPASLRDLRAEIAKLRLDELAAFSADADGGKPGLVPGPLYAKRSDVKARSNPLQFNKEALQLLEWCRQLSKNNEHSSSEWRGLERSGCQVKARFISRMTTEEQYDKYFAHAGELLDLEERLKEIAKTAKDHSQTLQAMRTEMQCLLACQVLERVGAELERRDLTSDDDVMVRLAGVLARQGPQGVLARRIRARWPVALIDECQDTDPLQAAIFGQLYAAPSPDSGGRSGSCVLIGDPKQAIYSFRGADVHAYLRFARRIGDSRNTSTLATCYRATPGLVAAVNALFGSGADALAGNVAAAMGLEDPAFTELSAREDADRCLRLMPGPATRWADEHRQDRDVYVTHCLAPPADLQADGMPGDAAVPEPKPKEICARICALDIQDLLRDRGSLLNMKAGSRQLQPDDMAVLVRSGTEAELIRRALAELGIATAYESDESSVLRHKRGYVWYPSPEAMNIAYLMAAMCGHARLRSMRRLLGCSLLRHTAAEVQQISADEQGMERLATDLEHGGELWRSRGFLPAFLEFMQRRGALTRLRAVRGGWSELTAYLHICELVQTGHDGFHGPSEQYRAYVREISGQQEGRDDEQLRVRRAEQRPQLRVLTIHKAKGREFPLVFLPFAAAFVDDRGNTKSTASNDADVYKAHDLVYCPHQGRYELMVRGVKAAKAAQEENETLVSAAELGCQEEQRLLYVALTRAQAACFIYTGGSGRAGDDAEDAAADAGRPVLAQLLDVSGPDALIGRLQTRPGIFQVSAWDGTRDAEGAAADASEALVSSYGASVVADAREPAHLVPARRLAARPDRSFAISSYTALSALLHRKQGADAAAAADKAEGEALTAADPAADMLDEAPDEEAQVTAGSADEMGAETLSRFDFPRGTAAGDFLHRLLQQVHFPACAREEYLPGLVRAALYRRGAVWNGLRRWGRDEEERVRVLSGWLHDIVHAPLLPGHAGAGRTLSDLASGEWVAEMQFCLPAGGVGLGAVDELCRRAGAEAAAALELPEDHVVSLPQSDSRCGPLVRGYLRGALDVVARIDCGQGGRYFVIDYKSTHLGSSTEDYTPQRLLCDMLDPAHRYDLQYMLYTLALYRHLCLRRRLRRGMQARSFYEDQIGGVLYLYLRGMQAEHPQQGIFSTCVDFELLNELDQLCSGPERT